VALKVVAKMTRTLSVFVAAGSVAHVSGIDNGLGLTPPMGWRSWNCYGKHINQTKMELIFEKMAQRTRQVDGVNTSLVDVGFNNCGLDDNWQGCGAGAFGSFHDAEGNPIINKALFPDMKAMTDHGHKLGLRVGWYMNNCICQEHSWKGMDNIAKHMEKSAQAVADYGFDGLKLDGCGEFRNLTWWAELLNATGREIMIENCHWGGTVPNQTTGDGPCDGTTDVSDCPYNFYRTSGDIRSNWGSMTKNLHSTMKFQGDPPLSRPGAWAYPDMMEVGRMASVLEDRAHFGAWVITSSPLILGYDLNDEATTDKVWDIITNREAIAINQAWAGHPGRQIKAWSPTAPVKLGNKIYAVPCDKTDMTQKGWSYDAQAKAVKGPGGKCLDANGAGSDALLLNTCDGSSLQQYTIGDDGTINSVSKQGKCVDIWAGHGLPGGPGTSLYGCHGADNEKFSFEANGTLSSQGQLCLAGREANPSTSSLELWAKPLGGGKVAAFVLNNDKNVTASFGVSEVMPSSNKVSVRDVWARKDLGDAEGSITVTLGERDSALLVLAPKSLVV